MTQTAETGSKKDVESFEFTDIHNLVFDVLARRMKLASFVFFALALSCAVFAVRAGVVYNTYNALIGVVATIISAAMGLWTMRAAGRVGLIVSTEGDDLSHLMTAVQELRKLFTVQALLVAVVVVLFVVTMVKTDPAPH
jgi:hypothetical protein